MFLRTLIAGVLFSLPGSALAENVAACGTLKPNECDREARATYDSDRAKGYRMFLAACELRSAVSCHMLGLIEEKAGRSGQRYFAKGCEAGYEPACDRVDEAEAQIAGSEAHWLNFELGANFAYQSSSVHSFGGALRYTPVVRVVTGYLDLVPILGADFVRSSGGPFYPILEAGMETMLPLRFWKPEIFLSLGGGLGVAVRNGTTDASWFLGGAFGYRYATPKLGFIDRVTIRFNRHLTDPALNVGFLGIGVDL